MTVRSPVEPREVVVVGGGIAGVEALMALADLGDNRLRLSLVADRESFVLPRESLGVPWGDPLVDIDLERLCRGFGARFVLATVTGVDAAARQLFTADGAMLPYERLLLAPGATRAFAWPATTTLGFGQLPDALAERTAGSVAVLVPTETTWSLPAYQLALMAAGDGRDVKVMTAEPSPLDLFGPGAQPAIERLLDGHGVTVEPLPDPAAPVESLADTVVALPLLEGPALAGLPADAHGFVAVDTSGAIGAVEDVRVVGDATHHPIKQGGLAAQQADVAAAEVVRSCGGAPLVVVYAPVLRGKLEARDDEALYLRRALDGLDPGRASSDPLWQPPSAVCAWRLARWLDYHRDELDPYAVGRAA